VVRAGFCPHPNPLPEGEGEEGAPSSLLREGEDGALSSLPSPFGRGTEGEGKEQRRQQAACACLCPADSARPQTRNRTFQLWFDKKTDAQGAKHV